MSKRLQVLMSPEELRAVQERAGRERLTVGEWVRRALRQALDQTPTRSSDLKVKAIQKAYQYDFPSADIDDMNAEIEEGYGKGLP